VHDFDAIRWVTGREVREVYAVGATFPSGPAYRSFTDRFADAYRAELAAFVEFAEHGGQSPAAMSDALEAFCIAEACELSRARHEPVSVAEARE
jgi:myo-inositol 2-dehydrogenase / D-chiro-inositol 1-dehydrogenase